MADEDGVLAVVGVEFGVAWAYEWGWWW